MTLRRAARAAYLVCSARMDDLGAPTSYLTLPKGVPVYSSDGEDLGKVECVLSAPNIDIFDGVILDTSARPGGHRFVDAPEVARSTSAAWC